MEELVQALIENPVIRAFVEGLVVKIVAEIFHRRTADPVFLQASDQVFSELASAKSDQEIQNAQIKLQKLIAGS